MRNRAEGDGYLGSIKTVITDKKGGATRAFCYSIAIIEFQLNIHLSSLSNILPLRMKQLEMKISKEFLGCRK